MTTKHSGVVKVSDLTRFYKNSYMSQPANDRKEDTHLPMIFDMSNSARVGMKNSTAKKTADGV